MAPGPSRAGRHRLVRAALPKRPRPVLVLAAILFVASALGAWRYLTHEPLETNLQNLASTSAELDRGARSWTSSTAPSGTASPAASRWRSSAATRSRPLVRSCAPRTMEAGAPAALQPGQLARRPPPCRSRRQAGGPGRAPAAVDRQLRHPDALSDADRKALRLAPARRLARPRRRRRPARAGLAVRRARRHARADRARQHRPRHRFLEHARSAPVRGRGAGARAWPGRPVRRHRVRVHRHARRHGARRPARDGLAALGAIVVVVALLGPSLAAFARCSAAPSGRWRCSPRGALRPEGQLPRLRGAADHDRHRHRLRGQHHQPRARRARRRRAASTASTPPRPWRSARTRRWSATARSGSRRTAASAASASRRCSASSPAWAPRSWSRPALARVRFLPPRADSSSREQ